MEAGERFFLNKRILLVALFMRVPLASGSTEIEFWRQTVERGGADAVGTDGERK